MRLCLDSSFGDFGDTFEVCQHVLHLTLSGGYLLSPDTAGKELKVDLPGEVNSETIEYTKVQEKKDTENRSSLLHTWFVALFNHAIKDEAFLFNLTINNEANRQGSRLLTACYDMILLALVMCVRPGVMQGFFRAWKDLNDRVADKARELLRCFCVDYLLPKLGNPVEEVDEAAGMETERDGRSARDAAESCIVPADAREQFL